MIRHQPIKANKISKPFDLIDKWRRIAHPVLLMNTQEKFSESVRTHSKRISESGPIALSGLYDLTATRLVRFSASLTGNRHDAEDAVQSVLLRVASHPHLLADAVRPWHYLLRMVRNESLLLIRRRKRCSFVGTIADLLMNRRHADADSEYGVESQETRDEVWTALQSLPRQQSEVIVLKVWEEMTFAQISEVLRITPSTAASRYRYGIEKLSRRLHPTIGNNLSAGVRHE